MQCERSTASITSAQDGHSEIDPAQSPVYLREAARFVDSNTTVLIFDTGGAGEAVIGHLKDTPVDGVDPGAPDLYQASSQASKMLIDALQLAD